MSGSASADASRHEQTVPGLVDHLFRHQAGQAVATLVRIFGPQHLDLAEDVVQDTLLKALRHWAYAGVPEHPGAWIVRVARNRALDILRRERRLRDKQGELARALAADTATNATGWAQADDAERLDDDRLRLIFTCCHPTIPFEARVALTLKTLCGFSVAEIARAFLAPEATIAQRIVRAKRLIRERALPFEVPAAGDLPGRLDAVLAVLYLLFNEGYDASTGENLVRGDLCAEAIRLTELLATLPATDQPVVHALLALLLLQAARLPSRLDEAGALVLLAEQRRERWDQRLVARGLAELGRSAQGDVLSAYHIQAGIAACHVVAPTYAQTDWQRILDQYDALRRLSPSPVVALNRAVALMMVAGPAAALAELERLRDAPAMASYPLFHATEAAAHQLLAEPGAAVDCYRRALALAPNAAEQRFLEQKLASCSFTTAAG